MARAKLDATDRVNLLLTFVPYLLEHSPISVSELASTFDVTTEHTRELIRLLAVSGVPGDSGMYQHQDLFDIDWDAFEESDTVSLWNHIAVDSTPKLSRLEAASLIAGLQYLAALTDGAQSEEMSDLLTKLGGSVSVSPQPLGVAPSNKPAALEVVELAIAQQTQLQFVYHDGATQVERRVDPLRIEVVGQHWYLRAWCHLRSGLRTFRLSRMSDVSILSEPVTGAATVEDLSPELFTVSDSNTIVRCSVHPSVLPLLAEYQPVIVDESDDSTGRASVDIAFGDLDAVTGLIALHGSAVTILSPDVAVARVTAWAQDLLSRGN